MKVNKVLALSVLALGFSTCPARGDLPLPFTGSAESFEAVFKVSNTNQSNWGPVIPPVGPIPDPRCAGMFLALGPFATGVYGFGNVNGVLGESNANIGVQGKTNTGTGVEGIANNSDATNYGGKFESKGKTGYGVYGVASNSGDAGNYDLHNYGGFFESNGYGGIGIYGIGRWGGWFESNKNDSGLGGVGIIAKGSHASAILYGDLVICSYETDETLVTLGEGLDYAEGFDVSDQKEIEAGCVLIIDPGNPGKLTISQAAYDSKVAGIVAGANGLGSGVRLGADKFDYDVALAGRVYCNVEATRTGVEPGDLLTTSEKPGYAMKAVDYERARGAILGKAMEKLEKGKSGQILVLVTLQ